MQTYWSILEKVKGSALRLTKMDDEIYAHLKEAFPEFDPAATIDEDAMKSAKGKSSWRNFMMVYEKKIDDYNFGTMVRNSSRVEYEENTTIFGESVMAIRSSNVYQRRISNPSYSSSHAILRHRDRTVCTESSASTSSRLALSISHWPLTDHNAEIGAG